MLEAVGAGLSNVNSNDADFVKLFSESELKLQMNRVMDMDGVSHPSASIPEMVFDSKLAASGFTQMRFLVCRFFDMYWRTASYNVTRCVLSVFLALILGLVFTGGDFATYEGIQSGAGMLFISAMFNGMVALMNVIPMTTDDRDAYYRERASHKHIMHSGISLVRRLSRSHMCFLAVSCSQSYSSRWSAFRVSGLAFSFGLHYH